MTLLPGGPHQEGASVAIMATVGKDVANEGSGQVRSDCFLLIPLLLLLSEAHTHTPDRSLQLCAKFQG